MVLRIAHRGASGYAPENTIAAFRKAIQLKSDIIEMDVHKCGSGELVAIHNSKLGWLGFRKKVSKLTLDELRNADINGEKIPLLSEALMAINRKAVVNIEIKGKHIIGDVASLIKSFVKKEGWSYKDFLVSTFDFQEVRKMRKMLPEVRVGLNITGLPFGYSLFASRIGCYSVHIKLAYLTKWFVRVAHKRNLKVFVWTVNDVEDIKWCKRIGVDGIITDYPDRVPQRKDL